MVAFYTYMDYNQKEIGTHHVFVFDRVVLNYGNGYHEYSGVFSAPRSGLYMSVWSLRVWEQSVVLIVAGSTYTSMYNRSYREDYTHDGEYSDADETASSFALVHLNEGDDVYLRTHSSYSGTGGVISNEYGRSSFGGWLLMHV
ncbi:Collagen alpha-2(VIII) chain [Bonamia ostreae]|uniref:Collagen alpha-2(VIII) chain n=1 Tax=Bonamia ostreae TaxID=126728 RepID=A0ABV2AS07_9EUKA